MRQFAFNISVPVLVSCILGLCLNATAMAQVYRYKDDSGNVVLNRTIPPKYVPNGYDILNDKGRVIERVPPALTPEQIAARDAERERQRIAEEEKARQAAYDNELRQLYSHPNDAVRVLERRIQDIDAVIQLKRGQIESANNQILDQETDAADIQRKGLPVPDRILQKIKLLRSDITNAEADIQELQQEREKVISEFDAKIKRLEMLTKRAASDYPKLLEKLHPEIEAPTAESEQ